MIPRRSNQQKAVLLAVFSVGGAVMQAYLKLRNRSSSAVSVKKLCEMAMISKTTFYSHYETIEALHHKICGEFVMELLSQCRSIDSIQSEPSVFVVSIFELFAGNMSAIDSNPFQMLFISRLIKLYCNSSQTRCPISARFSRAIEKRGR